MRSIIRPRRLTLAALTTLALLFVWGVPRTANGQKGDGGAAAARFRITLTGFAVNHQSDDDILEGDGKGDEVYLRGDVWTVDKSGNVNDRRSVRTALMGDINNQTNPPRLLAGKAGDRGGFRSGDKYPTNEPWLLGGNRPQTNQLPLLFWEGTLTQGENAVAIFPSVWEWDNRDQSDSENKWDEFVSNFAFPSMKKSLASQITSRSTAFIPALIWTDGTSYDTWELGNPQGTRPIGIETRPGGVGYGPSIRFKMQAVSLTYDSAMTAWQTSPGNIGTGIFAVRYTDKQDHGDYTLYLTIEKLAR